jgi:hypothetical protein
VARLPLEFEILVAWLFVAATVEMPSGMSRKKDLTQAVAADLTKVRSTQANSGL